MMISAPVIALAAGAAYLLTRRKRDPEEVAAEGAAEEAAAAEQGGSGYSGGYASGGYASGGTTNAGHAASAAQTQGGAVATGVYKKPKPNFSGVRLPPKPATKISPQAFQTAVRSVAPASLLASQLARGMGSPVIPVRTPIPLPKPTQPVNASQTSVLNAQTLLSKLGIPFGVKDGLYGPKTAAAWAQAVAKYPPPQGPDYDKRANFSRVNGTTALVYRPSAERLRAVAMGKPAPISSAVPNVGGRGLLTGIKVAPAPITAKPPGYNRAAAQKMAPDLVKHLKARGRDGYSRVEMRKWQTYAGIKADGIYGRGSAAALKHFASNAPAAFFAQGEAVYPHARG